MTTLTAAKHPHTFRLEFLETQKNICGKRHKMHRRISNLNCKYTILEASVKNYKEISPSKRPLLDEK